MRIALERLFVALACAVSVAFCSNLGLIQYTSLFDWTRDPGTPIFGGTAGNFAGDPHVWHDTASGNYYMVYTTDSGSDTQAIGMATSANGIAWTPVTSVQYASELVLAGAGPSAGQENQETAFYYKTPAGEHQIYYTGYDGAAEGAYASQIYKATATNILGPYTRSSTPVIPFGASGTFDDAAMTSPSIVEHEGALYMTYIGWDDSPNGPSFNVLTGGATAPLDGSTWTKTGSMPFGQMFGVEAHTEKGPDGLYYRVGVSGDDFLAIAWADHPFGPFEGETQVLTPGGVPVGEGDSITSPSLLFIPATKQAYMYYAAVDTGGFPWMTGLATTTYTTN